MDSCGSAQQPHPRVSYGTPTTELGHVIPHLLLYVFLHQPSLVPILLLPLWRVLHLALQTSCRHLTLLLLLYVFHLRPMIAFTMPHLRGKYRRGVAWYTSRGKKVPNSDPPPENKAISALSPILAPTPIEPLWEATSDLSPLSNPYGFRVEWFDTLGNLLGYAPPPLPPLLVSHLLHPLPPATGLMLPLLPHPFLPPLTRSDHGFIVGPHQGTWGSQVCTSGTVEYCYTLFNNYPDNKREVERWSQVDILMSFL